MVMRNYRVIYEFDAETGQVTATTIPELNHVSSYGRDFEEAERAIKEAAVAYLEALAKEGESPPPEPIDEEGSSVLNGRRGSDLLPGTSAYQK
jgi:predicted RNase H-like HicB family nuclease